MEKRHNQISLFKDNAETEGEMNESSQVVYLAEPGFLVPYLEKIENADPSKMKNILDFMESKDELPSILSIVDGVAFITIDGPLTKDPPSFIARFFGFGGTSYTDIIAAVEKVSADESVDEVRLLMNTPGGETVGVDEVFQAVRALSEKKHVTAENHGIIASAGYWIAVAANDIVSTAPTNMTGSIGTIAIGIDRSKFENELGIKTVRIISRQSPKKGDIHTKGGRDELQDRVDALTRVFIQRVSEGRGVSEETVASDFGRGGMLVSQDPDEEHPDAMSVGMIDGLIPGFSEASSETDTFSGTPPFKDFPIVDKRWDADAAVRRVRKFTGSTKEPSQSYRQAFFWFDPKNTEDFTGYKLPLVDVVNGKLVAVRRGVFAANGAMSGARGQRVDIPESDRPAVQRHIDRYIKKTEKLDEQKKKRTGSSSTINPAVAGNNHTEGHMETLEQFFAENPTARAEHERALSTARAEGVKSATEGFAARVEAVKPFIGNAEYPDKITSFAMDVLSGDINIEAFKGAVMAFDMNKESTAQDNAEDETDSQGETTGGSEAGSDLSTSGELKDNAEFEAETKRDRERRGQGV